eukprot:CAMPEP_0194268518 /NCGR_PEP_ID=MMETSP0169-20130528/2823_1 /TAXON_ID=218684 /ORGANISM="Corethron pennatum, Strain L29A3" /LENGTH=770 /DNA_ID=CAMNT_0039009773 /DNA_START=184 /DNA_END=2493 /DNA_ORIENTATION=-
MRVKDMMMSRHRATIMHRAALFLILSSPPTTATLGRTNAAAALTSRSLQMATELLTLTPSERLKSGTDKPIMGETKTPTSKPAGKLSGRPMGWPTRSPFTNSPTISRTFLRTDSPVEERYEDFSYVGDSKVILEEPTRKPSRLRTNSPTNRLTNELSNKTTDTYTTTTELSTSSERPRSGTNALTKEQAKIQTREPTNRRSGRPIGSSFINSPTTSADFLRTGIPSKGTDEDLSGVDEVLITFFSKEIANSTIAIVETNKETASSGGLEVKIANELALTGNPTYNPTGYPPYNLTKQLANKPTEEPRNNLTKEPTGVPTRGLSDVPSGRPTRVSKNLLTQKPTNKLSNIPTDKPTREPTEILSSNVDNKETSASGGSKVNIINGPVINATNNQAEMPSSKPTVQVTNKKTNESTNKTTTKLIDNPSEESGQLTNTTKLQALSGKPSDGPIETLTGNPTYNPTDDPPHNLTNKLTNMPTKEPRKNPTKGTAGMPTREQTDMPSGRPTRVPTNLPTQKPTNEPSNTPTGKPTRETTNIPSGRLTKLPTNSPTNRPIREPIDVSNSMPTSTNSQIKSLTVPPTSEETDYGDDTQYYSWDDTILFDPGNKNEVPTKFDPGTHVGKPLTIEPPNLRCNDDEDFKRSFGAREVTCKWLRGAKSNLKTIFCDKTVTYDDVTQKVNKICSAACDQSCDKVIETNSHAPSLAKTVIPKSRLIPTKIEPPSDAKLNRSLRPVGTFESSAVAKTSGATMNKKETTKDDISKADFIGIILGA